MLNEIHSPTTRQPFHSTNVTTPNITTASAPGRYATALFALARDEDQLDAVARDMAAFHEMIDASADLRFALSNPDFLREQKLRALNAICERINAHRLSRNCIGVLAQHGRIALIGDVAGSFQLLLAHHRKEQHAELISARPLSMERQNEIRNLLEQATGGNIRLSSLVDPSLLAGLVLRFGSLMIDCSLQTKLTTLSLAMKETK